MMSEKNPNHISGSDFCCGAGEGNRTPVTGLGSQHSAIELHPHIFNYMLDYIKKTNFSQTILFK